MLPQSVLVFDIETIPDVALGRRLYGLESLADDDVVKAMRTLRVQKTGTTDFLSHPQHRIVAISAVLRSADSIRVWSLGDEQSSEAELLRRFFDGIEKFRPTLVSWNGSGFDLPVIHYRALANRVASRSYWETGDHDRDFKFNNYLNRYHARHIDLMDVLSGHQARAFASLEDISIMLGLPGKMGISGSDVWEYVNAGQLPTVRAYCETDVLNTYLIYLHYEYLRGALDDALLIREEERLAELLEESSAEHLQQFLKHWKRKIGGE